LVDFFKKNFTESNAKKYSTIKHATALIVV